MKRILLITCMIGSTLAAVAKPAATGAEDADPRVAAFSELLGRAQRSADSLLPDELITLMEEGRELGRPQMVSSAVRSFLSRRADPGSRILRLAAENAKLTGDYRTAVMRYRQFLQKAPQDADASLALGEFMQIMVDYTGQGNDAMAVSSEYGDTLRQSALAKQYDGWFLDKCYAERAVGPMAKRLATIFSEKLPLEQERYAFWHQLDRLSSRLESLYPGYADAIIPARALVPLIREDPVRAARLAFLVENIAFHEARAGKDADTLSRDVVPTIAAARAYLDLAPTAQTLRQITAAFAGGPEFPGVPGRTGANQPDQSLWSAGAEQKQECIMAYGFSKLPETEQIAFLNWEWNWMPNGIASSDQWIALGAKHPGAFRKAWRTARLPWNVDTADVATYKAQASFLEGHSFYEAVVINAMAGGDDLNGSIQHLIAQAAWQMPFVDPNPNLPNTPRNVEIVPFLVFNKLIPTWLRLKAPAEGADRNAFLYDAQTAFADGALFNNVMTPFSPQHVRHALNGIWESSSKDAASRDRYIALLGKLAWVPFIGVDGRDKVFDAALASFRRWGQGVRKELDELAGKEEPEAVARRAELETIVNQMTKIEEAFKKIVDTDADPAQAPNQQCRDIATLIKAVAANDAAAYAPAAKSLYASIREYQKNKTPFGAAVMEFLMTPRSDALACIDHQLEIFADQVALRSGGQPHGAQICVQMLGRRGGWRYDGRLTARAEDNELRDRVATILANAINATTAKDGFDGEMFNWYRGVVRQESEQGQAVVSAIIDRDIFTKNNVNSMWHPSPVCGYLALVRNEFPSLQGKYPTQSWFDDRMAVYIKQTGTIDSAYWNYGGDREQKVITAIAELYATDISYAVYLGLPNRPATLSRDDYFKFESRIPGASPAARSAYLKKIEAAYGKTRFDPIAAGVQAISALPVKTADERKAFFDRLRAYTALAKNMPYFFPLPALPQVNSLKLGGSAPLAEDEILALAACLQYTRWSEWNGTEEPLIQLVHDGLMACNQIPALLPVIPEMWRIAALQNRRETMLLLGSISSKLMEAGEIVPASAYSTIGLEIAQSRLPDDIRNALSAIRTKMQSLVGGTLMVERTDRRYPILAAQSLFHAGRVDSAWGLYLQNPKLALTEFKDLDLGFTLWIIKRLTSLGLYADAELLSQTLMQWIDAAPQGFDIETRAQVLLVYADIAFAKQEYPRAKAQYERVVVAKDFADTQGSYRAELKIAEVDRLTRNFDPAQERLEKLDLLRDSYIQAEARFQMALLRFDQEDWAGAKEQIGRVFTIAPNHTEAGLLEGKLNVRTGKLIEGTEVKIGLSADQQTIIPGRPLRVGLEDRNLSIVGKATDIEVRVWTESGDEEFFLLFPFGDSKTRFCGEVNTEMAATEKGDHVLQVLGRDKVHYGFSEAFRKATAMASDEVVTLDVITDSELYAASGRIPTREEQERLALEASIRSTLEQEGRLKSAARQVNVTGEGADGEAKIVLSAVRSSTEIKPGNPIYIRVIDQDRNITHQKDTITVRATTESGDTVAELVLEETDTHTAVFEGKLTTASAPATAFASDTEEGRDPTTVIVADMALPPWVALGDNNRNKVFTIDMKDSVELGNLTLTADVTGRKLKRFAIQSSMNGSDFSTIGSWPNAAAVWDGSFRMRMVNYGPPAETLMPANLTVKEQFVRVKEYFDVGRLQFDNPIQTVPGKVFGDLGKSIRAVEGGLGGKSPSGWTLAHLQGTFYIQKRQKRTFQVQRKVDPEADLKTQVNPVFYMAVDGALSPTQIRSATASALNYNYGECSVTLTRGYHTVDFYAVVHANSLAAYELLWDVEEDPYVGPVPETIFTAAEWLAHQPPIGFTPTDIKANEDNSVFEVAFAPESRSRVLRFRIFDFESDAPAIRKIALNDAKGKKVLPADEDLIGMRKNDILEIVPGDKITISYTDPSVITQSRETLEAFLTATFYNASLVACLMESDVTADGTRRALLLPNRRFRPDNPMTMIVSDPDADTTENPDKVPLQVRTISDQKTSLAALENAPASGSFVSRFFPILAAAQRDAEITVTSEDDVIITYRDEDNTDYGIPWDRVVQLEPPLEWMPSELRVYDYSSKPLDAAARDKAMEAGPTGNSAELEFVPAAYSLTAVRPESAMAGNPVNIPFGGTLMIELLNPSMTFSALSEAEVYVQVLPFGSEPVVPDGAPFDPNLPGTIRYRSLPGSGGGGGAPLGYGSVTVMADKYAGNALDDGRFVFNIGTVPGTLDQMKMPTYQVPEAEGVEMISFGVGCLTEDGKQASIARTFPYPTLRLRPKDRLRVATDSARPGDPPMWEVWDVHMFGDPIFDVMDQRYKEPLKALYVGDRLYLRIVDLMADSTMEKDTLTVSVVVNGDTANARTVPLMETFENTGVFKGNLQLIFEGLATEKALTDQIAVPYGASVVLRYTAGDGRVLDREITVHKGADGGVISFTKRFDDADIAVQTQFTMAEAYFEMAKKYRALKEEEVARRTIAQGKKLLEEAIRDFPKSNFRVQADYLLANLAFESGEQTQDPESRKRLYREAVSRFGDVIGGYPDSEYAPKSQFKKALVFERMEEIDTACEEYVKLSYRYPNNPLIAETISRLGLYFFNKGRMIEKGLGAETDLIEEEKNRMQAREFYRTAAQVFGRLSVRFPDHKLAASTKVLSAENWLRAKEYAKAITTYESVVEEKKGAPDLIAQAMYWCGDAQMQVKNPVGAYRMFKRLTWDYPESMWARYARGRLADSAFAKME